MANGEESCIMDSNEIHLKTQVEHLQQQLLAANALLVELRQWPLPMWPASDQPPLPMGPHLRTQVEHLQQQLLAANALLVKLQPPPPPFPAPDQPSLPTGPPPPPPTQPPLPTGPPPAQSPLPTEAPEPSQTLKKQEPASIMSLVSLLFSDWWEDLEYPHRVYDQNFGLGIRPDQLMHPRILERFAMVPCERRLRPSPLAYYRPWSELLRSKEDGGISTVKADKDKFQVILDVQQFKPEEINVKVVDNFVMVEAKHEEKQDEHGWISRQFMRKYMIPAQCDIDQVTSNLSLDGVLTITAPRKDKPKAQNERTIKIEHTGKPAIQEKAQEKMQEKKEKK